LKFLLSLLSFINCCVRNKKQKVPHETCIKTDTGRTGSVESRALTAKNAVSVNDEGKAWKCERNHAK
jgi:hypothetical protein